jgi:YidC/Oxa1 family membrane protein insertase
MQQRNLLLFFVLSLLLFVGWSSLSHYLWPPPPKQEKAEVATKEEAGKPKSDDKKPQDKKSTDKKAEKKSGKKVDQPAVALRSVKPTPSDKLIALGEKDPNSKFHLYVQLDPLGAGWRSMVFNKFQSADYLGRPEWANEEKTIPLPLELVPAHLNRRSPSFLLYAFDVDDPADDKPLDTLGRIDWTVLGEKKVETLSDGRLRESVSFQAETQGVIITKTYSLSQGQYHVGLEVRMRLKNGADKNVKKFRYQLTGAHGLPVEGKWYTSIFRNAMIARVDKEGNVYRDLQDLRQISHWGGGNEVLKEGDRFIIYAMTANQYFASGIVVDNEQKQRGFLRQARPTLEAALTHGVVTSVAEDGSRFDLKTAGGSEETFYLSPDDPLHAHALVKGAHIAVLHHTAPFNAQTNEYPEVADQFFPEDAVPALWVDDITVRVATEPVELKGDEEIVHKYLLYNGPVKVSQLTGPPGLTEKPLEQGGVDPALVNRYHDDLHLNTLTDYQSPGGMGTFASKIYWTALVIKCTNIMHAVLAYIHAVIPSYGLCIIVLTVLVRGMMFPLSRKQALMSLRMQQLAPELKKLQEKYKDDRQAMGMAQMELYRKHGVNPFGSCWVLLLQMPIFMGLYFALQESIHFRLAEFWPTWIPNLAAPDMLFSWSQNIPFISRIEDYGSFFYLGPYFNLLPVIAVALMIGQQKMMTPPPTDDQQAMQQKMMKYMMIFFGLMFYKVAAGLCLYFIASSVWGFCERKLLPKKKVEIKEVSGEGYFQRLLRRAGASDRLTPAPSVASTGIRPADGGVTTASSLDVRGRTSGKRGRNKRRQGQADVQDTGAENGSMLGRWRKRLREWWIAVLKEAEKKNRS